MKKTVFFENINGIRFICFLLVFFRHAFHNNDPIFDDNSIIIFLQKYIFRNGNIAVNFFFVISGFLITYLLIEERKLIGKINIKYFLIRRILRTWPLYFICVFIGFIGFPIIKQLLGLDSNETANPIYYFTFLSNFDLIESGRPDSSILGVLWSVSVEEQFYLVWPIVLSLFPIKKYWIPFSFIILSSLIFRFCNKSYLDHELHTFSCMGDIAIGAFGAWFILQYQKFKVFIINLERKYIVLLYFLFVLIFFFRDEVLMPIEGIRIFERIFIASVLLFIILEQNYSKHSFYKMSNFKRITNLGKITYSLYCLHFIGIIIAIGITEFLFDKEELFHIIIIDTIISISISILISKISYRYIEVPSLKLKRRFSYIKKY